MASKPTSTPRWNRIVLKLSGEALAESTGFGLDNDVLHQRRVCGNFPTDVCSLGGILGQVIQVAPAATTPTTHFQCCLADMISRCTRNSPAERPTFDELLNHPLLWSAEECIIFLAQFVNPFLPTNARDDKTRSKKFRELSANFIGKRNYSSWIDVMETTTNTDLRTFWEESRVQDAKRGRAESRGKQKVQFQLLKLINNHVSYHHPPFVPEAALLEAFPYLVMDAYHVAIANRKELGSGFEEFLKSRRATTKR